MSGMVVHAVVLVLGRQKQKDQSWPHSEFEASLGYVKQGSKIMREEMGRTLKKR